MAQTGSVFARDAYLHQSLFEHGGTRLGIGYVPGESATAVFGGNSNWRGPIWMPVNFLIIEALLRFHAYYGDDFRVECPVGSGRLLHLGEVAAELSRRFCRIFLRDKDGRRPVFGDCAIHQADPCFRDHLLFYEFFHGDNGRGLGASHQTGWTALIALLLESSAAAVARLAGAPAIAAVGQEVSSPTV